jgi:pyruvate dehydrogenase E2 component (dihydrolipoamide acetyltransferase)
MHPPRSTRRQFAASLAATGAASLLAACARRAPAPASPAPATPAPPDPTPAAAPPPTSAADAAADQLLGVVAARYGSVFPGDHRADVHKGIGRTLQIAEQLRRAAITNAADPFTVCGAGMGGKA